MYSVSDAYKEAVASGDYDVDAYISIGTGIDTTAADDVTSVTGDLLPMSNTAQSMDAIYEITEGLATFEGDGIPTATGAGMVAPPVSATDYPPEVGLWSSSITDADGAISWAVTIALSQEHTSALRVYTQDVKVTAATIAFSDGTTDAAECTDGYFQTATTHTYTSITITVTGTDSAYRHVRLVEIEFGASRALAKADLTGSITMIDELDPTETSMPLRELDFTIINVLGEFDLDNPGTRIGELAIGYPLWLTFTVVSGSSRWSVPMGRFTIGERSSSDTSLSVSAFDGRYTLSQVYKAWTLDATVSLGESIEAILLDYNVRHYVDEDLFAEYPEASYSFTADTSYLDDMLAIQQAYAIYFVPTHEGTVRVTHTWPSGTYGTMTAARLITWPSPQQTDQYNYITVGYQTTDSNGKAKTVTLEADLRTDSSEAKMELQIGNNKLITTADRAQAVLDRIKARLWSSEVEANAVGDPAMDLGDVAAIPGRWTQDAPAEYTMRYAEYDYTGGLLTVTARGTKG